MTSPCRQDNAPRTHVNCLSLRKALPFRGRRSLVAATLGSGGTRALFEMAEGDARLGQIVRRHLERHLVAGKDTDVVLPHFSRGVGDQLVAVFEIDAETGIGEHFGNQAFEFKKFFFSHYSFQ